MAVAGELADHGRMSRRGRELWTRVVGALVSERGHDLYFCGDAESVTSRREASDGLEEDAQIGRVVAPHISCGLEDSEDGILRAETLHRAPVDPGELQAPAQHVGIRFGV